MSQCGEVNDAGEPCAEPADHKGPHCTEADADGMATAWGYEFDPEAQSVPCPNLCGLNVSTTPGKLASIAHNPDGSHTFTEVDGEPMTMSVLAAAPRHLNAV